ncbi:MAG TPA: branched-chain amino acid ABC transporter permease [Sphingomicrobium sp.]|nr:branched-chain amino acid ABC transporter permease [Sphingomicrobium sp.]
MELSTFFIQLLNSLQYGMLLFLIASGLTLTFGVMGVINLAHGAFFMIGAYLAFQFARHWNWPLPAAYAAAITAVVVVGACVERSVLAPLANRGHLDQVLVTYGLILIFDELAVIGWGNDVHPAEIPALLRGSVHLFGPIVYPLYRLVLSGVGLLCAIGLYLLISRTRLGMIVRAGSFDRTMVRALGINVTPIFSLVFGLGAALAALAGVLAAPILSVAPGMGDKIIIIAFVVVVIGGIGSIKGAFVGALLVGLFDSFGKILFPSVSSLIIYALMAAVLIWRPRGLFGKTA